MKRKKILIVDDKVDNLQIIFNIFNVYAKDYILYQANSGNLAYSIAQKVKPDLIITDWDMPDLSGIELIKKIKHNKELRHIPAIMATAVMTSIENLEKAFNAGAVDFIRKPIDEVELLARANSALAIADYYSQLVQQKDNQLIENTLFLIKNNEFNIKITKKLNLLHDNLKIKADKLLVTEIIKDIEEKIKGDSWQRFETSFKSVHEEFYKNLIEDFPNLTPNELKLCAFLKMGLNTKDIASILYLSPDSVKVNRYRLRKKLNLNSDESLQSFFSKY